jgi:predicted N-acetyltransferase YhbS
MTDQIVFLRDQPQHLSAVAQWIHAQWWSGTGTPVQAIERWLETHLNAEGFPATLIACRDGQPAGSVCLHETEAEDRPAYWPYLGALFVRSANRGRGTGVALVRAIEAHAGGLGHRTLYLNAGDPLVGFYESLGFRVIERGYGRKHLNIMARALAPV